MSAESDTLSNAVEHSLFISNELKEKNKFNKVLMNNINCENGDSKTNGELVINGELVTNGELDDIANNDDDDKPENRSDESELSEDDNHNDNLYCSSPHNKSDLDLSNFENSSESDWDEELCADRPKSFGKIYMHPTKHGHPTFVPSDLHPELISSQMEIWHPVSDGQFDDADL